MICLFLLILALILGLNDLELSELWFFLYFETNCSVTDLNTSLVLFVALFFVYLEANFCFTF